MEKHHNQKIHSIDGFIINLLHSIDKGNFGSKDKIIFFNELSFLIKGGVSLSESMKIIDTSSTNYAVKEIARSINFYLHQGKEISYAMNRLPDYFDEKDFNIIKSGEKSGNLKLILKSIADEYTFMNDIKNKYMLALTYPIILIIISIVAVISLFAFILPGIFEITNSFDNIQLPLITRVLKDLSTNIAENRQMILWTFLIIIGFMTVFFSSDSGKKVRFNILLRIPLFGNMTRYYYLIKLCRYMKIMLQSGMNYVNIFTLLRDILNIPAYQSLIENILAGLQRGESIYSGIKHHNFLIPNNVASLIKVGEEIGNLPESLDNILEMHQQELNNVIDRLAKSIEPLILIVIGAIVVVIALGVFGLILNIMDGVGVG